MYYGEKRVENPIRWGMVGGGRGSQIGYIHRSAAPRDFNFELVAGAFDIDPERGKDFGKQLHVDPDRCYLDYKTMFAEEAKRPDGVQAVSIATPNGMHYEVCKAALEAGLHVVCEKPLCFTSEQADELVKLAEEKHRVVGVTYGYSGHQLIQQARQMIKNGDLGEIRVINMSFAFAPCTISGWRVRRSRTRFRPQSGALTRPRQARPSHSVMSARTRCSSSRR